MYRFIVIFLFFPAICGRGITHEALEHYYVSSIPVSSHQVVALNAKSVEERYKEHYEGKPGVRGLTSEIFTDVDSGRKFRKINIAPDGSCMFYSAGVTREQLTEAVVEMVKKYNTDYFSHVLEYLRGSASRILVYPSTLEEIQETLNDLVAYPWLLEGREEILEPLETLIDEVARYENKLSKGLTLSAAEKDKLFTAAHTLGEKIDPIIQSQQTRSSNFTMEELDNYKALMVNLYHAAIAHHIREVPDYNLFFRLSNELKISLIRKWFLEEKMWVNEVIMILLEDHLNVKFIYGERSGEKVKFTSRTQNAGTPGAPYLRYIIEDPIISTASHVNLLIPLEPEPGLDL